jgi:hypothetical protein
MVGCGRLDPLFVPLARRRRIYVLSDPDRRCSLHFLALVERRTAGFALEYQRVASAIPAATPGHFRDNICIGPNRRLNLPAE